MATPIDIIGGFYTVDGRSWAAQDCVNYLPTAAETTGTKTPSMLKTPPGLRPYVEIGDGPAYAIRGGHDVEGRRFVVSGQTLYQISNTGVALPLGTVPGVGRVSMAHNQIAGGNELLVVNGNAGYVWNTLKQTFTRITDQGYPGAFLADFVDGYLMQVEPFGRYLFHSDLTNANEYNTLDRFEAEAQPDRIVSMLVDHGEVWAFGDRTVELFQNTGSAQGTFQPKGITLEQGCAGRFTPAKLDNSVFWLGNDGIFYRADGYSPVRISTHAIEDAIADSDWSQAFAFTWSSKGHKVYYCTFPDGQTWGYDVSSRLWHRRASYHPVHEVARRWRLNDLFYSNGEWVGCDSMSGKLFILDWDYMFEGSGEPFVSERVTQISYSAGRRFSVDALELEMLTGQAPTIPTEFPIQPEGPMISGDAPDGSVGVDYDNFVYTHAIGDKPLVSSLIVSGALPPGFAYTGATHTISKVGATVAGSYTFTIRDTDQNGLWAEVRDTVQILPAWEWMEDFGGELYGAACDEAGRYIACGYTEITAELWSNGPELGEWQQIADVPTDPMQPRAIAWGKVGGIGYWVVSAGANVIVSTNRVDWSLINASSSNAILVTLYTGTGFLRLGQNGASDHCAAPTAGWTTGNIGVPQDVRSAVSNPEAPGVAVAFCSSGAIRRTQDNGATWFGVSVEEDPHPAIEFSLLGSIWLGNEILAYKRVLNTVVCIYRSTDDGVTFSATNYTIADNSFSMGPVSHVQGLVMAPVGQFSAPAFTKIWGSANGLPPFVELPLIAPDAPQSGVIYSIVDGRKGSAIAIGRYAGGTSFAYKYAYGTDE